MRTFFLATAIAATLGLFLTAAGCGNNDPEVTPAADTDTTLGEAQDTSAGVDGNTEPPLPDVTSAVESVPEAETGDPEVAVAAASPEEFQAVLASHKGKVILVDFWATWCKPCVDGLPHTTGLAHENADRGLVVLTMCMGDANDPDETADALEKLIEKNVTIQNYICTLGGGDESFDAYNIGESGLPHYKLYDRDGKLVKEFRNDVVAKIAVSATDVDEHVEKLLAAE